MSDSEVSDYNFEQEIDIFQKEHSLIIPDDLKKHFELLRGCISAYHYATFFEFYSLLQFQSVKDVLGNYRGVPDYHNIINTLYRHEECYVFADYSLTVFAYAIRLNRNNELVNEIYVICGDKYKIITNSFSEFVELYLKDDISIYL
ncbi:MAG TPA: SMI1/KNR4 family protein [Mucilaginibacter sp.]|nr:SMI1/KNR4 family protein [Mucilaginibacter sp.]